jgi:hypothetical protein
MHDPASPIRRLRKNTRGAAISVSSEAMVMGFRALCTGSNQAQFPKSVRATPLRAIFDETAHACGMGGRYMATFCAEGFEEMRSMSARSIFFACSSFCACSSNL